MYVNLVASRRRKRLFSGFTANAEYDSPENVLRTSFCKRDRKTRYRVTPRRALAVIRYRIIFVNNIFLHAREE